jgi:hypothetical protein
MHRIILPSTLLAASLAIGFALAPEPARACGGKAGPARGIATAPGMVFVGNGEPGQGSTSKKEREAQLDAQYDAYEASNRAGE